MTSSDPRGPHLHIFCYCYHISNRYLSHGITMIFYYANHCHNHFDILSLKSLPWFKLVELPMSGAQAEPEGWVGQDLISAKVRLALSMPSRNTQYALPQNALAQYTLTQCLVCPYLVLSVPSSRMHMHCMVPIYIAWYSFNEKYAEGSVVVDYNKLTLCHKSSEKSVIQIQNA